MSSSCPATTPRRLWLYPLGRRLSLFKGARGVILGDAVCNVFGFWSEQSSGSKTKYGIASVGTCSAQVRCASCVVSVSLSVASGLTPQSMRPQSECEFNRFGLAGQRRSGYVLPTRLQGLKACVLAWGGLGLAACGLHDSKQMPRSSRKFHLWWAVSGGRPFFSEAGR